MPAQPAAAPAAARAFRKPSSPERLYSPALAHEPAPSPTLEEQIRASLDMVERRKAGEQGDGTLAVMAAPAPRPAVQACNRLRGLPPPSASRPRLPEFSSRLVLEVNALVDVYAVALVDSVRTSRERS